MALNQNPRQRRGFFVCSYLDRGFWCEQAKPLEEFEKPIWTCAHLLDIILAHGLHRSLNSG